MKVYLHRRGQPPLYVGEFTHATEDDVYFVFEGEGSSIPKWLAVTEEGKPLKTEKGGSP